MSQAHGSPSRSYMSYGSAGGIPYEERVGYFSVMDSSACKIPQSSRFKYSDEATPGPGYYDGAASSRKKTGGTIGRSQRFHGARGDGDEFLTLKVGDTPGPASYTPADAPVREKGTGVVFGRAERKGLYAAGATAVGPGSYQAADGFASPRTSGAATFGRAVRKNLHGRSEGTPGPGAYSDGVSVRSGARGGTFGRATRSTPGQLTGNSGGPGCGYYSTGNSTNLSRKGGAWSRAPRSTASAISARVGTPGPGSYTPLHAVSSGNVRHK